MRAFNTVWSLGSDCKLDAPERVHPVVALSRIVVWFQLVIGKPILRFYVQHSMQLRRRITEEALKIADEPIYVPPVRKRKCNLRYLAILLQLKNSNSRS